MSWTRNELAQAIGRLDASQITDAEAAAELESEPVAVETVTDAEREAALAAEEQRYADFWGGQGTDYEAMAERHFAEHRGGGDQGPGPYDQPWWDGERMASDRERSPGLVAELEAADLTPEVGCDIQPEIEPEAG